MNNRLTLVLDRVGPYVRVVVMVVLTVDVLLLV